MNKADDKKCAHPGCACTATPGESYCSPHCETARGDELVCGCGHFDCMNKTDAQAVGVA